MTDFPTVTELMREHAYLRSLRDRWSVGFERLRRLDLPGGDEPDANLPAMAADEIERLRAENDEQHEDLVRLLREVGEHRQRADELQAAVDEYVAARGTLDMARRGASQEALVRLSSHKGEEAFVDAFAAACVRVFVGDVYEPEPDYSACPYYQAWKADTPTPDDDHLCPFGCVSEPICVTCEPSGGWPNPEQETL